MSGGALWQDRKVGIEHLRAWKRIALVTDIEWMTHMTSLFGWMTPGEVRHFRSHIAMRRSPGLRLDVAGFPQLLLVVAACFRR
jgi:hypothetical protein